MSISSRKAAFLVADGFWCVYDARSAVMGVVSGWHHPVDTVTFAPGLTVGEENPSLELFLWLESDPGHSADGSCSVWLREVPFTPGHRAKYSLVTQQQNISNLVLLFNSAIFQST